MQNEFIVFALAEYNSVTSPLSITILWESALLVLLENSLLRTHTPRRNRIDRRH